MSLIIQPGAPIYGIKMENSAGQLTMELAEQVFCSFLQIVK